MHEARFRADDLGQMGQKGDDVVLDLALDFLDPRDVELGVLCPWPRFSPPPACGIIPSSAMASAACASISNQMRKRVSGDQIAAISGLV